MKFEYFIPYAPGRNEIQGKFEAQSEEKVREMLRAALGDKAAVEAIVRPAVDRRVKA
jgi:hypothetical protein